ncbi:DMT family transporter [Virgisporangium aurantiacum]|uniref:Transporter n=1 Tax=Virgisporangium aurantiacum TaxID=175570 RepID=A0A8J3YWJ7_9ACTN|nr:DMT family transporter [Virgisporangium aurantiacum]GIJ52906.1 transporter [Virgisporangium aurantiacum]
MTAATAPDSTAPAREWLPGLVVLAAIWGSSFLFIKVAVAEMHPTYLTLGRVGSGAVALLIVLLITRDRLPRSKRVWLHLNIMSAFGVVLPFTLFGYGEERVSSVLAGIWNAATPLIVLPMALLVFRTEQPAVRKAVGVVVGFLGVLVVLGVWEGVGGTQLTGQLMCFAAAACYGVAIPYQKKFLAGEPLSGLSLTTGQLLVATAQIAIVAPLVGGAPPAVGDLPLKVISSVLAIGVLGTGLAFVINIRNVRLAGASAASMVTYVIPLFAVVIGMIVLGEGLSWYQPVGALIVLFGVAVSQGVVRRPTSKREVAPAPGPASSGLRSAASEATGATREDGASLGSGARASGASA